MRTSLHILLKDLRHFWFLAFLAVVSVLICTLGVYWNLWQSASTSDFWQTVTRRFIVDIAQNGPPLVIFVVVIAVMQADVTVGDKAFWRTRPIARGSLLGAKLLFLLATLILPAVVANIFVARAVDASGPMTLGIVLESAGTILVVALLAALVASLTSTMIQAIGVVLAAVLIFVIMGSAFAPIATRMSIPVPWQLNVAYPGPRIATLGLYGAVALLIALTHQVLTLRTGRTLALYAVMVPIVIFGASRWPIMLGSPAKADEFPATLAPSEGIQIMLKPPSDNNFSSAYIRDWATRRDVPAEFVSIEADMGTAPVGRIVQVQSISSKLRFGDGRELTFPATDRPFWPGWSHARQVASICKELGLDPPPPQIEGPSPRNLRLFTIASDQARSVSGKPATLLATLKLYELAFHEEMRLPAREGVASNHDGQRWELRGINPEDGEVFMTLRHLNATTMFDPSGAATSDRSDGYLRGFVLLNRKLGEYAFTVDRWGSSYSAPGVLSVTDLYFRFKERWHNGGVRAEGAIDAAWLGDAELVILVAKTVGTFEKAISLDNFQVPKPPDDPGPPDKPFWQ
jgi:hypothetical protein